MGDESMKASLLHFFALCVYGHGNTCGTCVINAFCNTNLTDGCSPDGLYNGTFPKPSVKSYHIHIMYEEEKALVDPKRSEKGAQKFIQGFRDRFGLQGPNCTSLHDDSPWICEYSGADEAGTGCAAPFMSKTTAFSIPLPWYEEALGWAMRNRGTYDIFIHPNTGCVINDHVDWSLWGGTKWPIRLAHPLTTQDQIMNKPDL